MSFKAYYTKAELAGLVGRRKSLVTTYTSRGKLQPIMVSGHDEPVYSIVDELTVKFIESMKKSQEKKAKNSQKTPESPQEVSEKTEDAPESEVILKKVKIEFLTEDEIKKQLEPKPGDDPDTIKKKFDAQRVYWQARKDKQAALKAEGEVIPMKEASEVINRFSVSILSQVLSYSERSITIASELFGVDKSQLKELGGQLESEINSIVEKNEEIMIAEIDDILQKLSETRSRGERK